MAKKRKSKALPKFEDCDVPNCLVHKFWPTIVAMLNGPMADAWVDLDTGELFVATGLRVLPDMEVVAMEPTAGSATHVECDCGRRSDVRTSLLVKGTVDRCWSCAATEAVARSN